MKIKSALMLKKETRSLPLSSYVHYLCHRLCLAFEFYIVVRAFYQVWISKVLNRLLRLSQVCPSCLLNCEDVINGVTH